MADTKEFTITLRWDSGHANVLAFVSGIEGYYSKQELCSGWHMTPEAALVELCEKCRIEFVRLSGTAVKVVQEEKKTDVFVWLARTFGSGK